MFNTTKHKKALKNYSLILFIFVLFASFICINISGGLMLSRWKTDLTSDSRYTLSKNSEQIISEIKSPLYIRIYLSSTISKDYPALYQYSQNVLRRLESYKNISPEKITIEIRDPEPYSTTAEEAQKLGLKSFLSRDGQSELFFGAILGNDNGDTHVIEQFSPVRAGYLESDISRAINKLNNPLRTKIGIITGDLPVSAHRYGEGVQNEWGFFRLLSHEYNLVKLSPLTAEIPYDIEAVIVIPSQKTSFLLAYALDQYLLRGGRVLLLVDPYSEEKRLSLGASNNIDKLLKNWGASVNFSNVIGNINIGEKRIAQNRDGEISYTNPLWLNLTPKNINTSIPFNKNISTINLRSAGNILLNKQERIKATPVFYTTQNSGTIETADLGLIDENELMQKFQKDNKTYNLSILLEGKADSAFTQNPLQNTGLEQDMLPFLPTSIKDGKLLLIADTDFLTDTAWINEDISGSGNTYDIVSYAQNGEFVLRALDYLTDAVNLSSIGSKQLNTDNLSVSQKIYQKKLQPYKAEYEQNKKHLVEKEELNKVWNEIVQNNETAVNMSMLKKIEQNKQEINNLKENLKKTEYHVRKETLQTIDIITWINVFIIPITLLLFLWIYNFLRAKRKQNKVREFINEYKIS